jgi:threonine dehydrogenase-like Zn-dependent dehydrogenase
MITVPARKLHPSETLSFEQLALVETLSIGAHAVGRAALEPGESVLVVGAGPIGLAVIQSALPAAVRLIATDVNEARLELCRRQLGVERTFLAGAAAGDALAAVTDGDGATVVFEATGNAASMERSFDFVASGGRLVLVGICAAKVAFSDPEFHRREVTLLASRNATSADFARVLSAVEAGILDTRPWVTHRAPLADVGRALPSWARPESGVLKAMVEV